MPEGAEDFATSSFFREGRSSRRLGILGNGSTGKAHRLGFWGEVSGCDGVPCEERNSLGRKADGEGHFIDW